jgi:protein TonB
LVIARLCVSEQGLVQDVGITQSSGFQGLDRSAIKALAQWRFAPIAITSANVSLQCFQTSIQFTLEG